MAISKILHMKDCGSSFHGKHLKSALAYITVPEKTQNGRLVSAVNCQVDSAFEQMKETKQKFNKIDKRQAYHIILSFKEGEVSADTVFELTKKFVDEYSIRVNEVKKENGNVKGFATVVFGDSFKITNIAIVENKDKGTLFVSMPKYKSSERDENGDTVYKDVCNPITAEFREELFTNILDEFERVREQGQPERGMEKNPEPPQFSVTVTPFEREGSNIRGLARIYFEDSFIVNNVNILQGKEKVFVSMPSYKSKQKDETGKDIYQDICYPVTKEFREKLYGEIERAYQESKEKQNEEEKNEISQNKSDNKDEKKDGQAIGTGESLPFR